MFNPDFKKLEKEAAIIFLDEVSEEEQMMLGSGKLSNVKIDETTKKDNNIETVKQVKIDNDKESKMTSTVEAVKKTVVKFKKPLFSITVDEPEAVIKVQFDYDLDLINTFKGFFKTAKYDAESRINYVNYNRLNVVKIDDFLNECYDMFGDLQENYNFVFNHIKAEVKKEVKRFSLMNEVKDSLETKKQVAKAEAKEGEYLPKDEDYKPTSTAVTNSNTVNGLRKQSIFEQTDTMKQTPEEASYEIMKDSVCLNQIGKALYCYDDYLGCYHHDEDEGIKVQLITKLIRNGLSTYTTDSKLKSIQASIKNYAIADRKISSFNNKFVAVRVKNSAVMDKATVFITYKDNGTRAFRMIESSPKLDCNIFADVELDADLLRDEDGNIWNGEDLNENKFYYEFKTNPEAPIYKLFLDTLFASKNFMKMVQRYFGSIFTAEIVFKALFLCGEGNDGKSVLLDLLKMIFKYITISFKLNKEDDFQYEGLKGKKLGFVSEIKKENFDEMMFKNLTGGDETRVNGKHVKRAEVDTKNMYLAIAMNYEDLFRIENVDDAMRRRFAFAKCKTSPRVISNFSEKLMNGFFFEEENKQIESQRLEFVHWLMEGALEALETNAFQDKAITGDKYGEDVAEFYESMLNKMAPRGEFFQEFKFEVLKDFTAVPVSDLYNYYADWADKEKISGKLGSTTFKSEFIKQINKKFNLKIDEVDMRATVDNANKRAFPITIIGSGLKSYKIQYEKHLVDVRAITKEEHDQRVKDIEAKKEQAKLDYEAEEKARRESIKKAQLELAEAKAKREAEIAKQIAEAEPIDFDDLLLPTIDKSNERIKELDELIKNEKDIKESNKLITERNKLVVEKNKRKI